MYIVFMLAYIVQASRYLALAMDKQPAPLATGSPVLTLLLRRFLPSVTRSVTKTLLPRSPRRRRKKKSQKTSHTLRQSQSTAQPSNAVSGVQMESQVPAKQDFDDPVVDLLCKIKEDSPASQTRLPGYTGRGVAKNGSEWPSLSLSLCTPASLPCKAPSG